MMMTVSEIVKRLIDAHDEGKDVNLNRYSTGMLVTKYLYNLTNRLKSEVSSKYGLSSQPRLVDIIAAVPITHKKMLLPKLKVSNYCTNMRSSVT